MLIVALADHALEHFRSSGAARGSKVADCFYKHPAPTERRFQRWHFDIEQYGDAIAVGFHCFDVSVESARSSLLRYAGAVQNNQCPF